MRRAADSRGTADSNGVAYADGRPIAYAYTDFLQPGILIYEPQADGSLALVAVENLVFIQAWEAAGNSERPTFHGRPYDLMADDPEWAERAKRFSASVRDVRRNASTLAASWAWCVSSSTPPSRAADLSQTLTCSSSSASGTPAMSVTGFAPVRTVRADVVTDSARTVQGKASAAP